MPIVQSTILVHFRVVVTVLVVVVGVVVVVVVDVVMIPGVEPLFARFLFVLDRRFPRSFNNDHRWFIDNATKSGPPQHQIPR